jgi:hypothetical protein
MSIRFDNAGDYLIRTSNLINLDANYTVSMWIYLTAHPGDGNNGLLWSEDPQAGNSIDALEVAGAGATTTHLYFYGMDKDGNFTESWGTTNLQLNTWYHVGLIRSANNSRIAYLNGSAEVTYTTSQSGRNAPAEMVMGSYAGNADPFNGRIAYIKAWTAALTTAELAAERYSISAVKTANLYACWTTPTGATRVNDSSANGYNWTAGGTLTDEANPPMNTLTATQASFTLTGEAAGLTAQRKIAAAQQSYTLTGESTGLKTARKITAAQASFALTGKDATLMKSGVSGYTLTAAQGSFTLTGEATNLLAGRKLTAVQASFTETGEAVGLYAARKLPAAQAAFALTGEAALFHLTRRIAVEYAAFTLTGEAVTLSTSHNHVMTAAQASFALTGNAAGLLVGHKLSAATGIFIPTGEPIAFERGYGIVAVTQTYTLTGEAASLRGTRRMTATQAIYTFTGSAAGLLRGLRMLAAYGTYTLTGETVGLRIARIMAAAQAAYVLTGGTVNLYKTVPGIITAGAGLFALTGGDAGLKAQRRLAVDQAAYTLTGEDAVFVMARMLAAGQGAFALTLIAAALVWSGETLVSPTLSYTRRRHNHGPNLYDSLNGLVGAETIGIYNALRGPRKVGRR